MAEIPFDRVIWDAGQCAAYLGQSYSAFIKRTQYAEGFPSRCQIPGKPRWAARAVTDWALGEFAHGLPTEAVSPRQE